MCWRRWACRAVLAAFVVLAGCSGDGEGGEDGVDAVDAGTPTSAATAPAGATCDREEVLIDSRGNTHVIDDDYADYDFHPPTSGPHFGGQPPRVGVYDEPLPEAKQVLALEVGAVVLQYTERVPPEGVARLEKLAETHDQVVVTPAAGAIDGGRAVAFTAWRRRQLCDHVADDTIAAAEEWIVRYAGKPPSA